MRYRVDNIRATLQFNETTLQKVIDLCNQENRSFVFVVDQVLTDFFGWISWNNPWLIEVITNEEKTNTYFEHEDPREAREQAKAFANNLIEVLDDAESPFFSYGSIDVVIKEYGIRQVIRGLNYTLNIHGVGIYLEHEEESILVITQFQVPDEDIEKENEILNSIKS